MKHSDIHQETVDACARLLEENARVARGMAQKFCVGDHATLAHERVVQMAEDAKLLRRYFNVPEKETNTDD